MKCKRCNSENINVQAVTETKTKGKGLYAKTIGRLVNAILWLFMTPIKFINLFIPKKVKVKSKTYKMAICQDCGKSWRLIR